MSLTEIAVNILTYKWRHRLRQTNHSYLIMTFCSSVWFMYCIWDTKMNNTDPPQLGGTKGGGMFEVWGWEKWGRQAAVTEQHTVTGVSQVESVLWEQHKQHSTGPCRGDRQVHWEWKGEIWDDVGSISRGPGKTEHEVFLQEDMCRHTQLETEEQWSRWYCLQAKLQWIKSWGKIIINETKCFTWDVDYIECLYQKTLGKEMATHSSIIAWRTPWTEEPGGL